MRKPFWQVDPRACGVNGDVKLAKALRDGRSPRMRGKPAPTCL